MTPSETANKVREAARLIIEVGHCKGSYANRGQTPVEYEDPSADSFCLTGAVWRAGASSADVRLELESYWDEASLESWNDATERTPDEVAFALLLAAEVIESDGAINQPNPVSVEARRLKRLETEGTP